MKKTPLDKATTDKPVHFPIDREQKAILVIRHAPSGTVIRTCGWTLNEVLAIMGWKFEDVWAVFKRPWRKNRGAVLMSPAPEILDRFDKLNQEGGTK